MNCTLPPHNLLLHPVDVRAPLLANSLTAHGPGTKDWPQGKKKKRRAKDPPPKVDLFLHANASSTTCHFHRTYDEGGALVSFPPKLAADAASRRRRRARHAFPGSNGHPSHEATVRSPHLEGFVNIMLTDRECALWEKRNGLNIADLDLVIACLDGAGVGEVDLLTIDDDFARYRCYDAATLAWERAYAAAIRAGLADKGIASVQDLFNLIGAGGAGQGSSALVGTGHDDDGMLSTSQSRPPSHHTEEEEEDGVPGAGEEDEGEEIILVRGGRRAG